MKLLLITLTIVFVFASGCLQLEQDGYYAQVVYIYDGDTVKLSNGEKVRYLGIDTPEMNYNKPPAEYLGKEAKEFNRDLVDGKKIRLEFDTIRRDKYDRLLAHVYVDGIFVNARLIEEGYAKVFVIPPNIKHADKLLSLQRKAKEEKKGLWHNW